MLFLFRLRSLVLELVDKQFNRADYWMPPQQFDEQKNISMTLSSGHGVS
jgi:hypothetical protein